ncbi:MAG: hypothetical protein ACREFC_10370, partial [Stellaceae bacterium]
ARSRSRHIVLVLAIGWIAALFGLLALMWFDAALWLYCEPRLGAPVAALIAGGALLLAAVVAAIAIFLLRREPPPVASPIDARALAAAAGDLDGFVREHKGTILIAAALAGLVLGTQKK